MKKQTKPQSDLYKNIDPNIQSDYNNYSDSDSEVFQTNKDTNFFDNLH